MSLHVACVPAIQTIWQVFATVTVAVSSCATLTGVARLVPLTVMVLSRSIKSLDSAQIS